MHSFFHSYPPERITIRSADNAFLAGRAGQHTTPVEYGHLQELCSALHDASYVGPFRNAINQGAGTYFDLTIGTSFVAQWNAWKAGSSRAQHNAIQKITEDLSTIFGYSRLEINASEDKTTLIIVADGRSYWLRDVGAGLAQFIILFGNIGILRPSMLLIDEPELNLHPSLQIDFLTSLASYTRLQSVVFATHSIGLARTTAERIFTFQRRDRACVVQPFEQTPNFAEFVGEMSFSTFRELGHDTVLLVEGATEVRAIQQFLRLLGKDHEVVVIHLGGSALIRSGVEPELNELARLTKNIAVLIDSERSSAKAPLQPDREAFVKSCRELGFQICVTERRALENYLTDAAIKTVKGQKYQALGPYDLLSSAAVPWAKSENWRIAREMSRADLEATDVGKFLAALPT